MASWPRRTMRRRTWAPGAQRARARSRSWGAELPVDVGDDRDEGHARVTRRRLSAGRNRTWGDDVTVRASCRSVIRAASFVRLHRHTIATFCDRTATTATCAARRRGPVACATQRRGGAAARAARLPLAIIAGNRAAYREVLLAVSAAGLNPHASRCVDGLWDEVMAVVCATCASMQQPNRVDEQHEADLQERGHDCDAQTRRAGHGVCRCVGEAPGGLPSCSLRAYRSGRFRGSGSWSGRAVPTRLLLPSSSRRTWRCRSISSRTSHRRGVRVGVSVARRARVGVDLTMRVRQLLPLLLTDDTLLCASAWNDNAYLYSSADPHLVYRSEFFPGKRRAGGASAEPHRARGWPHPLRACALEAGLGWLLTRALWKELEKKWPPCCQYVLLMLLRGGGRENAQPCCHAAGAGVGTFGCGRGRTGGGASASFPTCRGRFTLEAAGSTWTTTTSMTSTRRGARTRPARRAARANLGVAWRQVFRDHALHRGPVGTPRGSGTRLSVDRYERDVIEPLLRSATLLDHGPVCRRASEAPIGTAAQTSPLSSCCCFAGCRSMRRGLRCRRRLCDAQLLPDAGSLMPPSGKVYVLYYAQAARMTTRRCGRKAGRSCGGMVAWRELRAGMCAVRSSGLFLDVGACGIWASRAGCTAACCACTTTRTTSCSWAARQRTRPGSCPKACAL